MYHNLLRILSVSTFLRICCYTKTQHNWLQCYWSKIEGVRLITLFINQDSSCLFPCLRYGFLLKTFLQISSTKLLGTEHLLKHTVEICLSEKGEPKAFILLTILHILLYVEEDRLNSTDGSMNFGICCGISSNLLTYCIKYRINCGKYFLKSNHYTFPCQIQEVREMVLQEIFSNNTRSFKKFLGQDLYLKFQVMEVLLERVII